MRIHATTSTVLLLLAALVAAPAAVPAAAVPAVQCTTTNQFSVDPPKNFHYEICGVPDIDQRKTASGSVQGLPGGGACHCVPTSQSNWLAYIANHGYPDVFPGPGNYQASPPGSTEVYNRMTLAQGLLGQVMGTESDAEGVDDEVGCRTKGDEAAAGTEAWLESFGAASDFDVVVVGKKNGAFPRLSHAVAQAYLGGLVRLSVGWYKFANPEVATLVRDGGHAVSLVRAVGNLDQDTATLGIHDPSNNSSTTTQSVFTRDEYTAEDVDVVVFTDGQATEQTMTRINDYGSIALIDAYSAIIPKFGLAPGPQGLDALYPGGLTGHPTPTTGPLVPASAGRVVDVALVPHDSRQLLILEGRGEISGIDRLGGGLTTFARLPGVRRVTFGGYDERVYALLREETTTRDPASGTVTTDRIETLVALGLDGRELGRVSGGTYDELAFDPVGQRLLTLDLSRGIIATFSSDLEPLGSVTVSGLPGGASGSLTVDHVEGTAWVHLAGTGTATRVDLDGSAPDRRVQLGDGAPLVGLHASDGLLFATRDGSIVSFEQDGSRSAGTPFDGLAADGPVELSWTYTNIAPGERTGPEFRHVLPEDAAATVRSRGTGNVCPRPGSDGRDRFADDDGSSHEGSINCAADYGLAGGFADGTYGPGRTITRAQMATFIANLVGVATGQPLPDGPDAFSDDDGDVHEASINAVVAAGIARGTGPGRYSPGAPVRRGQMATFIAAAIDHVDDGSVNGSLPPVTTADLFADDDGDLHEGSIDRLATQGIVAGGLGGTFAAGDPVTRAQMATFVMQAADFLAEQGLFAAVGDPQGGQ